MRFCNSRSNWRRALARDGDEAARELDRLAGELVRHMHASPDDFDGRQRLWMRRENFRRELRWLEV